MGVSPATAYVGRQPGQLHSSPGISHTVWTQEASRASSHLHNPAADSIRFIIQVIIQVGTSDGCKQVNARTGLCPNNFHRLSPRLGQLSKYLVGSEGDSNKIQGLYREAGPGCADDPRERGSSTDTGDH